MLQYHDGVQTHDLHGFTDCQLCGRVQPIVKLCHCQAQFNLRFAKSEMYKLGWKLIERDWMPGPGWVRMLPGEYSTSDHPFKNALQRRILIESRKHGLVKTVTKRTRRTRGGAVASNSQAGNMAA